MTNLDMHSRQNHQWIKVENPTNRRRLWRASDNRSVVKSESAVLNRGAKAIGPHLFTSSRAKTFLAQKIF
jgi:hypothetical protein